MRFLIAPASNTHALRSNSPAIDAGISTATTDQRGLPRPYDFPSIPNSSGGDGSDIGAFERQSADVTNGNGSFGFDGDGRADVSMYRASSGTWYRLNSSNNQFVAIQFGTSGDIPDAADFDGDGKTDLAVFRPSTGIWYILGSTAGFTFQQFGTSEDRPVAADYDCDGRADIAVFRPSSGTWFINRSSQGFSFVQFGLSEDRPVESTSGQN